MSCALLDELVQIDVPSRQARGGGLGCALHDELGRCDLLPANPMEAA